MIVPNISSDVDTVLRFPTLLDIASKSTKREVLEREPSYIQYMKSPSEEYQMLAVMKDPTCFEYIKKPTFKVKLYVVFIEDRKAYADLALVDTMYDSMVEILYHDECIVEGIVDMDKYAFKKIFIYSLNRVMTSGAISKWEMLKFVIGFIFKYKKKR